MSRLPQKTPFRCPGCGHVQLEPPRLISTFCQSCGEYYEVGEKSPVKPSLGPPPVRQERRIISCHRCGTSHAVSPHALNTLCPCCNAAIGLEDLSFHLPVSRPVDIRGKLTISRTGSLNSSWIICGSAYIEGNIVGLMRSEGEVHLATNSICACQITAPAVFIEKHAQASFTLPVETEHLVVRGQLTGIVHCRGIVHVQRGGCLEAEVYARAVTVEKGGDLWGTCHVDVTQPGGSGKKFPNNHRETPWTIPLCPAF